MLQQLANRREAMKRLEQLVTAMPEYPIYREANGYYGIYIAGELQLFTNDKDALLGQLTARADWLRQQHDERTGSEPSNERSAMEKMAPANEAHSEPHQKLELQESDGEVLLYQNGRNDRGCPLYWQSGEDGVQRFSEIIANLPSDLRMAFFRERYSARLQILSELEN